MNTLSSELRATISRHVEIASPREILAIASALCNDADKPEKPDRAAAARAEVRSEPGHRPRYEVVGEIVRDHETKLEWTRCNVGQERLAWSAAKEACEQLELDGRGWRLPTQKELLSLVDYERHEPAIDPAFECESSWYWSSTPYAPSPGDCAWSVGFVDGYAVYNDRDYDGFVRAVRGGQF